MKRHVSLKVFLASAVLVAAMGLAHALTVSVWTDYGLAWKGQWWLNFASSSQVKVRVLSECENDCVDCRQYCSAVANVKVEVKANAEDGSAVQGYALIQVPGNTIREATIQLPKRITSLQFTKIQRLNIGNQVR